MSLPLVNPVELTGVKTRFGRQIVHDGIDLCVPPGDLLAIIGGSGEGKTTLLRHIAGLSAPNAGTVRLFGETYNEGSYRERRLRRQRFGMLFQHGALFSAFNVYDNIAFPLRELGGLHEDEIRDIVMSRLALVELEAQQAWLMPAELSGGMVKRAALARALALEPELLLLDEPTAGLDPERSAGFVRLVRSLHDSLGLTVIFVTHDVDSLQALASRVAVLADRRILAIDSTEEIMCMDHPFVETFFRSLTAREQFVTPWR
ncbi:ABC transporter ATP-binding protein [Uliginosibacterium sediminicola]|uniref:ATP-binding cassette domain-containing protein n=1 Tax=Uliginosibacterium sediminicola TaxID=2024550 RepID=A0ABU9YVU5_9RHOO